MKSVGDNSHRGRSSDCAGCASRCSQEAGGRNPSVMLISSAVELASVPGHVALSPCPHPVPPCIALAPTAGPVTGKMELFSAAFFPAVLGVLDAPGLIALGSVPVARYGRTIPQVGRALISTEWCGMCYASNKAVQVCLM